MKWSPLDRLLVITDSDWLKTFPWLYYTIPDQIDCRISVLVGKLSAQVWHLPTYCTVIAKIISLFNGPLWLQILSRALHFRCRFISECVVLLSTNYVFQNYLKKGRIPFGTAYRWDFALRDSLDRLYSAPYCVLSFVDEDHSSCLLSWLWRGVCS